MPVYNSAILRTDAEALIPEVVSREIIQGVPEQSTVLRMGRRLPPMSTNKTRMPVLAGFASAYFVNGDTGLKQTTKEQWSNKYMNVAEIAVILPIPEAVIDDVDYDIWGEVRPRIVEAFGIKVDRAVFYGEDAPSDWPVGLVPGAVAASQAITLGTKGDLYDDILGEDGVLALVEEDGYDITGHVSALRLKSKLRALRDENGLPMFVRTMQSTTPYELDGVAMDFPRNGAVDASQSLLISGDFNQLVYSIRQDLTYKVLTEAVIQDQSGAIIYNLAQQDMVALRVVMRLAWQIPNPINRLNTDEATRYPFSVLLPSA